MKLNIRVLLAVALLLFQFGLAKADSVDNVFRSIEILATIGNEQVSIKKAGEITSAQFTRMSNQYNLAYDIGSKYKSRELKKKLGREFYGLWKKNVSALKDISELYFKLEKYGGRLNDTEINRLSSALVTLETFRLFYVQWRRKN